MIADTTASSSCESYYLPVRVTHAPQSTLFPYTTLFRSRVIAHNAIGDSAPSVSTNRWTLLNAPTGLTATVVSATQINLRSEEHTSELQSHHDLVCRLLLEKKIMQAPKEKTATEHEPAVG